MPPEEIGDPECSALKAAWEPLLTQDFALLVFDKKKLSLGQDGCVGVVADLIAQLPGPYARQHSDFLLRYVLVNNYMLISVYMCPPTHSFIHSFIYHFLWAHMYVDICVHVCIRMRMWTRVRLRISLYISTSDYVIFHHIA